MNNLIIGLTGPTGAGKGIVALQFKKLGAYIINADEHSKKAVQKGSECLKQLTNEFTKDIIDKDGNLNRKKLASIAFSSNEKTLLLNSIVHPFVVNSILKEIGTVDLDDKKIIVIDAPLLLEADMKSICNYVISVIAQKKIRQERIIKRDNLLLEETLKRINAQNNDEFYISKSDFVIVNDGTFDELIIKVNEIYNKIISS
jgi:dephospho-CoA kinase